MESATMSNNTPETQANNDFKSLAFYRPVTARMSMMECVEESEEGLEIRALSLDEHDGGKLDTEKRSGTPSTSSMDHSFEASSYIGSTSSSARHVFDFHTLDEGDDDDDDDDDDNYSVMTYNTVDTSATNESVQSIIQRLQSETDRRRRRIMRRRWAKSGKKPMKPAKPEDPIRGITVEIRE